MLSVAKSGSSSFKTCSFFCVSLTWQRHVWNVRWLLQNVRHVVERKWSSVRGCSAGGILRWLLPVWMLDRDSSADCAAASTVDPSHTVVLFLYVLATDVRGSDGRASYILLEGLWFRFWLLRVLTMTLQSIHRFILNNMVCECVVIRGTDGTYWEAQLSSVT